MANVLTSLFKGETATVNIKAGGTEYFVNVYFLNSIGEFRSVNSNSFKTITLESDYTTPFLTGKLQVVNNNNEDMFNTTPKVDPKVPKELTQYSSTYDGQEYLFITISKKRYDKKACKYTDEIMVQKPFVITNTRHSIDANNKILDYFFIDLIAADFLFKKKEWTSNILIGKQDNKTVSHMGQEQLQVKTGSALKRLITDFTDEDTVNEKIWDHGSSTTSYTLPNQAPAVNGMTYFMSNYISSNKDLGILTYYNGKFQLESLKDIFNKVYFKDKDSILFKEKFTNAFKIESEDTNVTFTNKEAENLLPPGFEFIPITKANIIFNEPHPESGVTDLIDHSMIEYNTGKKRFNIFNKQGSIKNQTAQFESYIKTFPDADTSQLNINQNDLYNTNKITKFGMSASASQTAANADKAKISLQRKLLEGLSTCDFTVDGNINLSANKFLYMTFESSNKNIFAEKVPGFWYIISTSTTLTESSFQTKVKCTKFDKPILNTTR